MFGKKKTVKAAENRFVETRVDEQLTHIAFIMDGNGRWAKKRGLPRPVGHKYGSDAMKKIVRYCGDIGIKAITLYAFSTENWKRPTVEVTALMTLLMANIKEVMIEMQREDFRVVFLGDKSAFSPKIREMMIKAEKESENNTRLLNIAVNYGGRADILHAVNSLIAEGKTEVSEEDINTHLYTAHCAPPDLIVRTAGEYRISNFLLWQCAYSEFYFTPKLWPDMDTGDIDEIVHDFYSRKRRYGGL